MESSPRPTKVIPLISTPQIVPSQVCLSCNVCCRFPDRHSAFRPYFTEFEIQQAVLGGIDASHFLNSAGSHVEAVPNPLGEGYVCPAFDPETSHCRIYEVRPLDCQLYPFLMMWDQDREGVYLGWDRKCPFLVDQSTSVDKNQLVRATGHQANALSEVVQRFAQGMAARVESQEMIEILSANPQLVMDFQDDAVVIRKLPRLTAALRSAGE